MITVTIGSESRDWESRKTEQWISGQISNRKLKGVPVVVTITIHEPNVELTLTARDCPATGVGGGSRSLNGREQDVWDEWKSKGLCDQDFNPGNLISFLKKLRKLL